MDPHTHILTKKKLKIPQKEWDHIWSGLYKTERRNVDDHYDYNTQEDVIQILSLELKLFLECWWTVRFFTFY